MEANRLAVAAAVEAAPLAPSKEEKVKAAVEAKAAAKVAKVEAAAAKKAVEAAAKKEAGEAKAEAGTAKAEAVAKSKMEAAAAKAAAAEAKAANEAARKEAAAQQKAEEAAARGLVSRVVPAAELLDDALKTAGKIASMSQPIVTMAKDCVNVSFESSLAEGLRYERALFYSTFATADQKAGMQAFMDKAKAEFKDE